MSTTHLPPLRIDMTKHRNLDDEVRRAYRRATGSRIVLDVRPGWNRLGPDTTEHTVTDREGWIVAKAIVYWRSE